MKKILISFLILSSLSACNNKNKGLNQTSFNNISDINSFNFNKPKQNNPFAKISKLFPDNNIKLKYTTLNGSRSISGGNNSGASQSGIEDVSIKFNLGEKATIERGKFFSKTINGKDLWFEFFKSYLSKKVKTGSLFNINEVKRKVNIKTGDGNYLTTRIKGSIKNKEGKGSFLIYINKEYGFIEMESEFYTKDRKYYSSFSKNKNATTGLPPITKKPEKPIILPPGCKKLPC